MIYMAHKLDEVLKAQGSAVTVNAFNPGFMAATNFSGGHMDKARALDVRTTMPERYGELGTSSDALAQIAAQGRFSSVSGAYFDRSTNVKESSGLSYSRDNADELWEKSLEYCGLEGIYQLPTIFHRYFRRSASIFRLSSSMAKDRIR